jgi:hypothetical protein
LTLQLAGGFRLKLRQCRLVKITSESFAMEITIVWKRKAEEGYHFGFWILDFGFWIGTCLTRQEF